MIQWMLTILLIREVRISERTKYRNMKKKKSDVCYKYKDGRFLKTLLEITK